MFHFPPLSCRYVKLRQAPDAGFVLQQEREGGVFSIPLPSPYFPEPRARLAVSQRGGWLADILVPPMLGHRWRDTASCCFAKGEEGFRTAWQAGLSTEGPALSVPCPLCVSGLGTCSVSLRLSLVIWKHLQGNVAFTFLSYFFPCGTGNKQHQLFHYYLGRGYDFIVCLFMKTKNKKLYILHIYIIYMKHTLTLT